MSYDKNDIDMYYERYEDEMLSPSNFEVMKMINQSTGEESYFDPMTFCLYDKDFQKSEQLRNPDEMGFPRERGCREYEGVRQINHKPMMNWGNFLWINGQSAENILGGLTRDEKAKFLMLCTKANKKGMIKLKDRDTTTSGDGDSEIPSRYDDPLIEKMCDLKVFGRSKSGELILPPCITLGGSLNCMSKYKNWPGHFTRMYDRAIREIYNNEQSRYVLGIIVDLLKFVNRKYNVLCFNAEETVGSSIKPLHEKQITELFGVDPSKSSAFMDDLLSVAFKLDGYAQTIFAPSWLDFDGVPARSVFVNPNVFFAGIFEDKDDILDLFMKW